MTRWYRAYEGTVTDAKLGEVAMIAECSRSVAIAAWHALLEDCAATNDGGRFQITARRLAVILAEPMAVMAAVLNGFEELGMTQGGEVTAWRCRQFESDKDPTNAARQKRYRERRNARVTDERNGDNGSHRTETDTEKKEEPTSDEVGAAEPLAEPAVDQRQKLWAEGLPALIAMGVSEKQARPVIGRWLRDANDDAARVLGAIQRAREHAPMDPIPWITAGFAKIRAKQEHVHDRKTALLDVLGSTAHDLVAERQRQRLAGDHLGLPAPVEG